MTLAVDKEVYKNLLAETLPQLITTEAENDRALAIVEDLLAVKNRTLEQKKS